MRILYGEGDHANCALRDVISGLCTNRLPVLIDFKDQQDNSHQHTKVRAQSYPLIQAIGVHTVDSSRDSQRTRCSSAGDRFGFLPVIVAEAGQVAGCGQKQPVVSREILPAFAL